MSAAEKAVASARRAAAGKGGKIRVACAETMTGWLLAPVLRDWRQRFPDVEIDLREYTSADQMLAVLQAGGAGITVAPSPTKADEHVEVLGAEEIVVVAAPGHRFGTVRSFDPSELRDVIVVVAAPHDELVARFVGTLKKRGLPVLSGKRTSYSERGRVTLPPFRFRARTGGRISAGPAGKGNGAGTGNALSF